MALDPTPPRHEHVEPLLLRSTPRQATNSPGARAQTSHDPGHVSLLTLHLPNIDRTNELLIPPALRTLHPPPDIMKRRTPERTTVHRRRRALSPPTGRRSQSPRASSVDSVPATHLVTLHLSEGEENEQGVVTPRRPSSGFASTPPRFNLGINRQHVVCLERPSWWRQLEFSSSPYQVRSPSTPRGKGLKSPIRLSPSSVPLEATTTGLSSPFHSPGSVKPFPRPYGSAGPSSSWAGRGWESSPPAKADVHDEQLDASSGSAYPRDLPSSPSPKGRFHGRQSRPKPFLTRCRLLQEVSNT
jgi:hypothetical protein